ncbi:barstar (barnase inhibitor) [Actinomadura pelletieri DSM 43383]|uniref:Barstar (Barnase inhibitor) n=1 Tax=Actinomadura pelletieri DSM 43383 TaxID=1120940 RepID=A0A495QT98_9ACTN|nr:barstar family protein [Actinomadura pelletieri]RKS76736.1 barstar (barnase inhibitor) [Actinomadura pelletieri DSM 43383]
MSEWVEQPVAPRWLLVDDERDEESAQERSLALCVDIDGLFVEPAPAPVAELYTLIGCEPAGTLRDVLSLIGTDQAWLASIILDPVHDPERPLPRGCQRYSHGCSCMEELCDVTVIGQRPSPAGSGLMDIDLRGYLRILPEDHWPPARPPAAQAFVLSDTDGSALGRCHRTDGIFRERARPPIRPVTLVGCRPAPPLQDMLERRSARRSHFRAMIHAVDRGGNVVSTSHMLSVTVTGTRPSPLGVGLVDIDLDSGFADPLPHGAREIWDLWHEGRPTRPNLWSGYDRALRNEWCRAAVSHHLHDQPDRPPGRTYDLDGRYVTDLEGFYCALGEAVNGPGGYFGWDPQGLGECLRGEWGATPPFRLRWHHSDVARRHLVPGYDRPSYDIRGWHPRTTLRDILEFLTDADITVDLR